MKKSMFYGFRLTPADLNALRSLAIQEERTLADTLRRLIRKAAKECELLPVSSKQQVKR